MSSGIYITLDILEWPQVVELEIPCRQRMNSPSRSNDDFIRHVTRQHRCKIHFKTNAIKTYSSKIWA
ncbi:hypothetical protein AT959_12170 [Dechloromonas denitrificans]|uniref:Uncharacterized protein n=1 Tax=Dechloromonas denitrificans TaxID=281362 RepID=A0A133XGR0_9RHOO|nr:hypothetical protein AT959_12170 [Dechloromonas denitrificans]